jgi:glycosyltransferase involved in cell wall biosynthesis
MAMGKPVISTDVSGIPELIQTEENGILVNQKDPRALALAIDRIISGKFDLEIMGKNARNKIIENFNLKDQVEQMGNIFEEALSQRRS